MYIVSPNIYQFSAIIEQRNITISRKVTANTNLSIDKMNSHPINNVLKSYVEIIYLCSQTNSLCEACLLC